MYNFESRGSPSINHSQATSVHSSSVSGGGTQNHIGHLKHSQWNTNLHIVEERLQKARKHRCSAALEFSGFWLFHLHSRPIILEIEEFKILIKGAQSQSETLGVSSANQFQTHHIGELVEGVFSSSSHCLWVGLDNTVVSVCDSDILHDIAWMQDVGPGGWNGYRDCLGILYLCSELHLVEQVCSLLRRDIDSNSRVDIVHIAREMCVGEIWSNFLAFVSFVHNLHWLHSERIATVL
mmetsp:Transcript_8958/g.33051  ORF Transcript_8958/g.33051 Transcript_8958/m.33051 type:complete len:237 (+) Transcript_8958:1017-1727(+)